VWITRPCQVEPDDPDDDFHKGTCGWQPVAHDDTEIVIRRAEIRRATAVRPWPGGTAMAVTGVALGVLLGASIAISLYTDSLFGEY
jgi:hypothetical protein